MSNLPKNEDARWKREQSEKAGYSITKTPKEALESLAKLEGKMEREPITKIIVDGKGTEKQIRPKTPTELVREKLPPEQIIETPKGKSYIDWQRIVELNIEANRIWKEHYPCVEEATIRPNAEHPNKPILFDFEFDWHAFAIGFAGKGFIEDMNLLQTTPNCFMGTGGDEWDAGKYKELAHMQALPKYSQVFGMKDLTRAFTGDNPRERKIWEYIVLGNHTLDYFYINGILIEEFFQKAGIPMFPGMGKIHLQVGNQEYKIAVAHKHTGRSRLNLTLAAKRLMEYFWTEADIVATGHYHQKAFEVFDRAGKERVAISGGSRRTEEVIFELSRGYGYPSEGGVCVLLYPDERKMLPFSNLRDGIKFLKSELK